MKNFLKNLWLKKQLFNNRYKKKALDFEKL